MYAGRQAIIVAGMFLCAAAPGQDREYHFRFLVPDPAVINRLTRIVSIDNVVRDTVTAYANEAQWRRFRALGYPLLDSNVVPSQPASSPSPPGRPAEVRPTIPRRNHEIHHRHTPGGAGRACCRCQCRRH